MFLVPRTPAARSLRRSTPWLGFWVLTFGAHPVTAQVSSPEDAPSAVRAAQGDIGIEQGEQGERTETRASPGEPDPEQLSLNLVLSETNLTHDAIVAALEAEFQIPVVPATEGHGLEIRLVASEVTVSFADEAGLIVQRTVALPRDEARALDTIALLAGNLARDAAGALLAQLRAQLIVRVAADVVELVHRDQAVVEGLHAELVHGEAEGGVGADQHLVAAVQEGAHGVHFGLGPATGRTQGRLDQRVAFWHRECPERNGSASRALRGRSPLESDGGAPWARAQLPRV